MTADAAPREEEKDTTAATAAARRARNEMDKALLKYRIAAVKTPHSPQLWNNIGAFARAPRAVHKRRFGGLRRMVWLHAVCVRMCVFAQPGWQR